MCNPNPSENITFSPNILLWIENLLSCHIASALQLLFSSKSTQFQRNCFENSGFIWISTVFHCFRENIIAKFKCWERAGGGKQWRVKTWWRRRVLVSRNSRQTETEKTTNKRQIAKLRQARESQEERNSLSGDNSAVHCFYLRPSLSVVNVHSFELCWEDKRNAGCKKRRSAPASSNPK